MPKGTHMSEPADASSKASDCWESGCFECKVTDMAEESIGGWESRLPPLEV